MALSSRVLTILFISPLLLTTACPSSSSGCTTICEKELNFRMYLLQVGGGPDHNQEGIIDVRSTSSYGSFGFTAVTDWTLIDAPVSNAKVVGHAQGMHMMSDRANVAWSTYLNMVFQGDRFNGSTLQVMGVISALEGQWAIIGGTGELSMARGTVNFKVVATAPYTAFRQVDFHALIPADHV